MRKSEWLINRRFHRSLSTLTTPTDANHCHITLRAKLLRGCTRYPSASLQEQRFINREKDETPSLSDPGPLNVRRPHPHRVQLSETGCRNVEPNRKKTMEKIVCIGERSWQQLLERVEHLSALAQRLEHRLTPPQDDG